MSDLKLFRITGPKAVEVHGTGLSEVRRETQHSRRPNRLCGLARKMWRAPTEEPGGVLWETGIDRRRSFGVKRFGWR